MFDSRNLFDKLRSFNTQDSSSQTPEELFLNYCRNVLSGVERLHVDFKEKRDRRIAKLEDDDKRNLAKAVSGFANSSGGVLIWGLEDKSLAEKPVSNVKAFASNLAQLSPHVTDPAVPDIDVDIIHCDDDSSAEGFAIIHIPESPLPPHRVILSDQKIQDRYYFRSGESFIVASHTLLEDMFGRRPRPKLRLETLIVPQAITGDGNNVQIEVYIDIFNDGRAVAKFPYLLLNVHEPHKIYKYGIDGNLNFGLPRIPNPRYKRQDRERSFGGGSNHVVHPASALSVLSIRVDVFLSGNQDEIADIIFDYQLSAESIRPIHGTITIPKSDIWRVAEQFRDEKSK